MRSFFLGGKNPFKKRVFFLGGGNPVKKEKFTITLVAFVFASGRGLGRAVGAAFS